MYFEDLDYSFNADGARAEILLKEDLFEKTLRETYPGSAHHMAESIVLRGPVYDKSPLPDDLVEDVEKLWSETKCMPWEYHAYFPVTSQAVIDVIAARTDPNKAIGRVMITRLPPGGCIEKHRDEGPVPEMYRRLHCCVSGGPGNLFVVAPGDARYQVIQEMRSGQVFEVDVREPHYVMNNMPTDRIHVIVDVER